MATIALMGVQFAPRDASVKRTVDSNLVVTSKSPAIVFHSSTKVPDTEAAISTPAIAFQFALECGANHIAMTHL